MNLVIGKHQLRSGWFFCPLSSRACENHAARAPAAARCAGCVRLSQGRKTRQAINPRARKLLRIAEGFCFTFAKRRRQAGWLKRKFTAASQPRERRRMKNRSSSRSLSSSVRKRSQLKFMCSAQALLVLAAAAATHALNPRLQLLVVRSQL